MLAGVVLVLVNDIVYLIVTIGFFALCTLLVRGCDGIIGEDTDLTDTASEPSEVEAASA